jgi:MFS family permease
MEPEQPHPHFSPDPVPHEAVPASDAGGRRLSIDLTPLRVSRDFRLLFISQTVSFFGSMMSFVVLPVQMYQLTKSSLAVGMLGAAECVPLIVMALVGGALADYFDRRRVVQLSELLLAFGSAALIVNALLPHPRAWVLFVCAAAFAALSGLKRPSMQALYPRLVASELIPAVSALNSLGGTLGSILGPVAGGLLATAAGPVFAYSTNLITFMFSLVLLLLLHASPPPPDADAPSLRSIAEGLRYARSRPELMGTYLVDMNAMFFGMPMALFPAMAAGFGVVRRAAVCGPGRGRIAGNAHVGMDAARATPGSGGDDRGRVVGRGDYRPRIFRLLVVGASVSSTRGCGGRRQRPLPPDHMEPDNPRPSARTARRY